MSRIVEMRTVMAALALLVAFTAGAEAAELELKRMFGWREPGIAHVRLRSMLAPIMHPTKKRVVSSAVTVILTIKDDREVGKVCGMVPRINDALLRAWSRKPIFRDYLYDLGKKGNKTDTEYQRTPAQNREDQRLIKAVNKALRGKQVSEILVLKGTMGMGRGVIGRLPFSSVNGCDELKRKK